MINLPWWRLTAIGWAALFSVIMSVPVVAMLTPASNWFTVDKVYVADAKIGNWPAMEVVRQVHQPFTGDWTVRLDKLGDNGFVYHCDAKSSTPYLTDSRLPSDLDLGWWSLESFKRNFSSNSPELCNITPGEYRIITEWIIHADGYPLKTVIAISNAFSWR